MKNLILVFIALSFMTIHNLVETPDATTRGPASVDPFSAWASKGGHTFSYTYKGEEIEVTKSGGGVLAHEAAAEECVDHFRRSSMTEDEKLELADVCTNPKKVKTN